MKLVSSRYLGTDAAVIHTYTEGSCARSRDLGEPLRRTHVHLVVGRVGDAWKVEHTVIMDAR
ncbi:MAG: hypothetical protein GWN84_13580 [Gammaproteobacteria bacterium]|nr:hypothetical protein [Gammaproteobacteria bacterium]NIR90664.1 hypothetical protein [Gammaproteobacteria bacterium]NIU03249.1 hypothetical protein [Gammaproteobacteria bacterium]NIV52008.1 hypothetical protein [Gammaproteobacteria bacterium]NIX05590.1 hypothetical protein [Gammaproteobacteria bacterium]